MSKRVIEGHNMSLHSPEGAAVEAENNLVFVSSFETHAVYAFKRNARGNVHPVFELAANPTGISNPTGLFAAP